MHPLRKKRLTIVLFLLAGVAVAVGLTTYALRQNINLFYDPTQIASGEVPLDVRIRAGGMVEDGSVKRDPESLRVQFNVTDFNSSFPVEYVGILPDLFAEGQGIVAMGRIRQDGFFVADQVLAKHDENYMSPEVNEALERAKAANKSAMTDSVTDSLPGQQPVGAY
ncbi:cytochrome c maturation protein CcmE [Marinobacter sp.]|uniref:cytochrome c maturation protein CcmE n=1 Tax=Marinobacter sp. TaxID=50741 RepID=UPI002B49A2FA|nr:cytochrome c maturation protein CcmE [Marinobacter sp.]HKK55703.1 cytochrome c maturation protein CcmE [Marinobacter sp.]